MNRLLDYERGTLASGGGSISAPISLPGTNQEQGYNLDGLGNWSTTTIIPEGGSAAIQDRTHNKLNEVTAYGVSPVSTPVLYDHGNNSGSSAAEGNGNIVDDGVRTYGYDAFNRLTTISRKSDSATIGQYTYDAMGRRLLKVVSNSGLSGMVANGTIRYLYDQNQCLEELSVAGLALTTTRQFIWGQYIDELIQLKTYVSTGSQPLPASVYYLLSDQLWRSATLTDSSGNIQEAYDADAYGNTIIYSGPGPDNTWFTNDDVIAVQPAIEYIFTGRRYDPESQIYFYRARYYYPQLGRFISRDPIGYGGGINLYEYVMSQPIIKIDPTGESCCNSNKQVTTDCCGPDISAQLLTIATQMTMQFILSPHKTLLAQSLINPLTAGNAWDSQKLRSGGTAGGGGAGGPYNKDCQQGTGKCAGTVSINGICYDDGAANYWIAGVIEQILLNWSPILMSTLVGSFNNAMIVHTLGTKGGPMKRAFLSDGQAGTLGATASKTTNDYTNCVSCKSAANSVDWHWGVGVYNISGQA